MGILFPKDATWSPADWVTRGLFTDLAERGGLPPALLAKVQFCLDASIDTMDLRGSDEATLSALRGAVSGVISVTEQRGPGAFQQPEFQPVYLAKLRLLATQLDQFLAAHETVMARAAGSPGDESADGGHAEFPIGETLGDGAYRIASSLFGSGLDRVYLATDPDGVSRFLVSSTLRRTPSSDELRRLLSYASPGVLELEHVGTLDPRVGGETPAELTAIVERLPPGASLRHLITTPVPTEVGVRLAIEVATIVLGSARAGHLPVWIRPETVWGERGADDVKVTGLSDRGETLFRAAERVCFTAAPTYERRYTAPELIMGQAPSDRTSTFILSIMLAEWLTGTHPFPDAWTLRDPISIATGRHAPLDVPTPIAALLTRSFRVDPVDRPGLVEWVGALRGLPAHLAPLS